MNPHPVAINPVDSLTIARPITSLKFSLSDYFPKDAVYFYAFPAGEHSNFFNNVPPWVEELVAARPLVCAGDHVRVITFAASSGDETWKLLEDECGLELIKKENLISLSTEITPEVQGDERNKKIKANLLNLNLRNELIMAQPFLDEELRSSYLLEPKLVNWLNDKENLPQYVPSQYLPANYITFANGQEFTQYTKKIPLPCVVKVNSSSAGDGVRVCHTFEDLQEARKAFCHIHGSVHIEEYIKARKNFCIQFAIPFEHNKNIEIIGYNEQVIAGCGEFLGGVVNPWSKQSLESVNSILRDQILPYIRSLGWYGIGGFDALIDENGHPYFIDPNFRMTATFAFVCRTKNGKIKKPNLSFSGQYKGTAEKFRKEILSIAREGHHNQVVEIVSLTNNMDIYRFNAALLFDTEEDLRENATRLLSLGVEAKALEKLTDREHHFKI